MGFFESVGDVWKGLTGEKSAESAERAAAGQATAGREATAESRRQFDIGREQMAPWLQAGRGGLTEQMALMGLGGDEVGALRSLQKSPGYRFRMNEGQRGMEAGIGARGGMGSGKALLAGQRYGQDYASQEYGNRLSQLRDLSGKGQASAAGQAQMGQQFAQRVGDIGMGTANAMGAADIAGTQARQSGLGNVAKLALAAWGMSDKQLKENIHRIGTHKLGIGLYRWTFKEKPDDFLEEYSYLAKWGEMCNGVMSDEVREVMPEAVSKIGKYDVVNYSMLEA